MNDAPIDFSGIIELCKIAFALFVVALMFAALTASMFLPVILGEKLLKRAWRLKEDHDEFREACVKGSIEDLE